MDTIEDGGRIVNVASRAHYSVPKTGINYENLFNPTSTAHGLPEYAVSKLANILHAKSLAKKLAGRNITTYSLHPGVVASEVWRGVPRFIRGFIQLFMLSVEDGALTTCYCASSEEAGKETGLYYDTSRVKEPSACALDSDMADKLWEKSEYFLSKVESDEAKL